MTRLESLLLKQIIIKRQLTICAKEITTPRLLLNDKYSLPTTYFFTKKFQFRQHFKDSTIEEIKKGRIRIYNGYLASRIRLVKVNC